MVGTSKDGVQARRRRIGIIAFVLTPGLLLGGGLWTASNALQRVIGFNPAAACSPVQVRGPKQNTFTVNVLNASAPQGAAKQVAKQLPLRSFKAGRVGNDEGTGRVEGVGKIRYGPSGLDQALVAQKLLLPQAQLSQDFRAGTSVDLVLGPDFSQLAAPDRPMVRRDDVVVNVYNTTYFEGLGKKASTALTGLGFVKGRVGLDPKNAWITDVAGVRHGPDGELGAKLVQGVVPASRLILDPSIKGSGVDLLIGMKWSGVLPKHLVTPELPRKPLARQVIYRPCR